MKLIKAYTSLTIVIRQHPLMFAFIDIPGNIDIAVKGNIFVCGFCIQTWFALEYKPIP